jgi:hypothetical protein
VGGRAGPVTERSRSRQGNPDGGLAGARGDRNVIGLLTEMIMLPVTALMYGMELLVRAMQGTQRVTEQGVHGLVDASRRAATGEDDWDLRTPGNGGSRVTSGSGGDPEPRPAHQETATMDTSIGYESRRDRDLRDDTLKLVRYKILFVKRDYEVAFPEQEDLVYDNMDGTSFAAWKVAEFIQRLHNGGVEQPARWKGRSYPAKCVTNDRVTSLPEEDKKYLRVYYEVLERYPREKFRHEEKQIRVLEEIRDVIQRTDGCGPSESTPCPDDNQSADGGRWGIR